MKRSEFFTEMGRGLFRTVKEVTTPLISDDLDKLDSFMDDFIGVKWHDAGTIESFSSAGVHDLFLAGTAVAVINDGQKLKAYKKLCPCCQTMPQWISYEKKFKCMICEKVYDTAAENGELQLIKFPLKKEVGKLYIGLS